MTRSRKTAEPLEVLPVIFRAERSGDFKGDVTAVFPTLPSDSNGSTFTVYAHVGQHGSGSFTWYHGTRAAKPAEFADLLAELESIYGRKLAPDDSAYRLKVYRKMTRQHRDAFRAECDRLRRAYERILTNGKESARINLAAAGLYAVALAGRILKGPTVADVRRQAAPLGWN